MVPYPSDTRQRSDHLWPQTIESRVTSFLSRAPGCKFENSSNLYSCIATKCWLWLDTRHQTLPISRLSSPALKVNPIFVFSLGVRHIVYANSIGNTKVNSLRLMLYCSQIIKSSKTACILLNVLDPSHRLTKESLLVQDTSPWYR